MSVLSSMNPVALGDGLRSARTAAGLTQDAVARELDFARTTLVAIENGSRRVRDDEFIRLCKLYRVSANALLHRKHTVDFALNFRRTSASRPDDELTAEATHLLQRCATSYLEVEALLSRPLRPAYPQERPLSRGRISEQAEELSMELRNTLGVGLRPIEDLVWIAETELGIRVFERPVNSAIAGAFAFDSVAGACILLNLKHPRLRRTMTLAHEIGHLLTTRDQGEVLKADAQENDVAERFCSLFALALMMPAAAVRRRYTEISADEGKFSTRHLVYLARTFHVTVEAMCRRLEALDILQAGTYDMLRDKGLSKNVVHRILGESTNDASSLPAPRRLAVLVSEGVDKGLLSEGQAAEMLGLDRLAVREILDALSEEGVEARDVS